MIDPASAQLQACEGLRLHREGNPLGALACYRRALQLSPGTPDYLFSLGVALHDLERYDEALDVYRQFLDHAPPSAPLYHNLGNTLLAMDRYGEAIESYARALALMPEDAEALVTMGTALEQLGRYAEAVTCYEEALKRAPDCAEAHWNRALALLRQGEYLQGWEEFTWRWRKKGYTSRWRDLRAELWDGRHLEGNTILIHAEQAFGDTIQFVRYLPLVAERGGTVILECPRALVPLLETVDCVTQIIPAGDRLPDTRFHLPLLSLPRLFGTTPETIPGPGSYLFPPTSRALCWDNLVGNGKRMKIGLVWAGRKRPDPHRSCRLQDLTPLVTATDATFYSLQTGEDADQALCPPPGMKLIDLTGSIHDFADTAALIARLDCVVSIDTAVAHLAGAMGKRTLLLLPFAPDWRWMLGRNDSPWYPSTTLYRQTEPGNWHDPVNRAAADLRA